MVGNVPFSYESINQQYAMKRPCFMHIANTGIANLFKKYLFQDALSVFKFKLPETWDSDYFRYILLGWGYIAIFKTDLFGVIPQQCTLAGRNVFYRPSKCIVANPLINAREMVINEDCALVKLMPDYGNLSDLIDMYGDLMALAFETASINILNSRVSFVFSAENKGEADTLKALYDAIASGDPSVVFRRTGKDIQKGQPWNVFNQNVGQNYIAADIMETLRGIRDQFLTEIGIPNLSTRKRERMNLLETERNTTETICKSDLWLAEMQSGIKTACDMFPELNGKFSVELKYKGVRANAGETFGVGSL